MAPAMSVVVETVRSVLARWVEAVGVRQPGGVWKILAIVFALGNFKNIPFVWHIRFFRAFTYHLNRQPTPIPPSALFQPIITSSRTPITEMDYNLHKSNSTYFSDMDISRTHLFTALMRNAILKSERKRHIERQAARGPIGRIFGSLGIVWPGASEGTNGRHMIALGGVSCQFKREILPYKKFEMWTRLLTWDRKWFYLVTWIVKPGYGQSEEFSLQPWKNGKRKVKARSKEELEKAIYATAIAKYVIKKGRITVPAEQALLDGEMLPEKPEGWAYKGEDEDVVSGEGEAMVPKEMEKTEWNWDNIERERRRGLKFAEAVLALDGLGEIFDGGKEGVLGEYADLLW
ncbi:hypothetical protein P280DRAFT_469253 [Massarina eburnea CBS 473.64]|uniref:Capsule polysaccharide biosynthesis protein n=1 Tax=Massarina eburnea CBS 473.64 TaxID=1395130 RepID=A0A6A6S0A7_9PLEO|nr:hypothetical protein P280DRAFT_469253 [Massarina eburnea CBS 473.64]